MSRLVHPRPPAPAAPDPREWLPPRSAPLHPDGAPLDIGRLLATLRRRAWMLILGMLLLGGAAWQKVREQPRLYRASAVVQLVDGRRVLAGGLGGENDRAPYGLSVLSQIEILKSRAVAAVVVDSEPVATRVQAIGFPRAVLDRVELADSLGGGRVSLSFTPAGVVTDSGRVIPYGATVTTAAISFTVLEAPPTSAGTIVVLPRQAAVDRVAGSVAAEARKQTNLIEISYTAADPIVARQLVNRVALLYQEVNAALAQQQSRRRRVFIEEQLAKNEAQVAEAERALSAFRQREQTYSSREKFAARRDELVDLDLRRQDLLAERRIAGMLLAGIERNDPAARSQALNMLASSPGTGESPVVSRLYARLVEYETERAELTTGARGSAPTHPDVLRLDSLIAGTERQLASAVRGHITLLEARIETLDELRAASTRALEELPAAEAEEMRLSQNAEVLRDQGTLLRTEYHQARIAEAAEVGQVEIVDLAHRAFPLQGTGSRVIMFALLLGLVAGGGGAVALESADRSIKRREEVEAVLGRPVLATVPKIQSGAMIGRGMIDALRRRSPAKAEAVRRREVALASALGWRSPCAEAHRQLRTTLIGQSGSGFPRRVLITSSLEGEGKTSIATNLAITLARQQLRVLLLDCDLHAARLHRIFQVAQAPGLGQVLFEDRLPREVLQATPVNGLFVITAGTIPDNPSDAFGGARMRAMLNDLAHYFDVVVMDSSPVLAVSDAAVLAGSTDAVLVVVRAGRTRPADVEEAARQLDASGARIMGAVLNDPDGRIGQYGGYVYGYPRG